MRERNFSNVTYVAYILIEGFTPILKINETIR